MNRQISLMLLLLPALSLSACGGDVKESLGLKRQGPDAFNVVARPPLVLPPEFNLRPPAAPGSEEDLSLTHGQAKRIITGLAPSQNAVDALEPDTAEGFLLQKAGASQADESVRMKLLRESAGEDMDKGWLERAVPSLYGDGKSEDTLNPTEEVLRLRQSDKASAVTIPEENLPNKEK